MKKAFALLILALALPACDGLPPEFPAPDFTLRDVMGGGDISYSALKGEPAVVYLFASW